MKIGVKITLFTSVFLAVILIIWTIVICSQDGGQSAGGKSPLEAKGETTANIGAAHVKRILEKAIDTKKLTLQSAFDVNYSPIPNTDPQKFNTKYDKFLDNTIKALQDDFLQDKTIWYAYAVDASGYVPTHNTRFSKGSKKNNLTKCILNESHVVESGNNDDNGFLQKYDTEDGKTVWDFSTPIIVKNKRWGCFKVGIIPSQGILGGSGGKGMIIAGTIIIILISTGFIFFITGFMLKPLASLTDTASNLADGHVNNPIEVTSEDEFGQLADALERLRVSMKAAMDRLMRK